MPIPQDHIRRTLVEYAQAYPEESPALAVLHELLDEGAEVTSRSELRAHATAGAILVNDSGQALFVRRLDLDRWLTPGGHVEPGDMTLMGAALRELIEETGVRVSMSPVDHRPVHIDVHLVPADETSGEPEHRHIDFRFLFRTGGTDPYGPAATGESDDRAWRAIDALPDERLRQRVRAALD
ncbi:NUDIX hydrolase [uncultured Streptomyces sp.]|uniref:NUDIX hydrolase n=1 Tax=uncultured Streptomyces sp. TaxID=174707 RepID=UPI0026208EE9|nr:NUDIX domain-containing protein [uncultured Streptomyces sp.]